MSLNIANPVHEQALRAAVGLATEPAFAAVSTYCADMAKVADPPVKWAVVEMGES